MVAHLSKEAEASHPSHRDGISDMTVLTPKGELELSILRVRYGRFDSVLIRKYAADSSLWVSMT